jgi:hypothetical protein
MNDYRIKFLSLWSAIMDEERWHKFDSQACVPSCKGWNAWAPLCECGKNYCTYKPSGNLVYGDDLLHKIDNKFS